MTINHLLTMTRINTAELSRQLKEQMLWQVEEQISSGQTATFTVRGWSMRPLMNNLRDRAVVSPITEPLRCSDVVVFKYHGRYLLHRIIAIDGDRFTIKGDGVPFSHEVVDRADILAVLTSVIRRNGTTVSCSSPKWIDRSRRWNAMNPRIQYVILKFLRILEIGHNVLCPYTGTK